jgi:prefoldin subunit 5
MFRRHLSTIVVGLAIGIGAAASLSADDAGVQQIRQLIKKATSSVDAITDAKQQLQKTMTAYNALLAPDVKDRRDAFKTLQKELSNADKKRTDVSSKAAQMNEEADKLFKSWQNSAAAIQSPDLRQRSDERLKRTQDRFAEIRQTGRSASDLYTPFMKALQDQVTFLGHDLNPGAVANLKPDAEKLNAQATELYAAIDKVTAAANNNIAKLSAE